MKPNFSFWFHFQGPLTLLQTRNWNWLSQTSSNKSNFSCWFHFQGPLSSAKPETEIDFSRPLSQIQFQFLVLISRFLSSLSHPLQTRNWNWLLQTLVWNPISVSGSNIMAPIHLQTRNWNGLSQTSFTNPLSVSASNFRFLLPSPIPSKPETEIDFYRLLSQIQFQFLVLISRFLSSPPNQKLKLKLKMTANGFLLQVGRQTRVKIDIRRCWKKDEKMMMAWIAKKSDLGDYECARNLDFGGQGGISLKAG